MPTDLIISYDPVAIAIAAAGLRAKSDYSIESIAVPFAGPVNDDARETAAALAEKLDAVLVLPAETRIGF